MQKKITLTFVHYLLVISIGLLLWVFYRFLKTSSWKEGLETMQQTQTQTDTTNPASSSSSSSSLDTHCSTANASFDDLQNLPLREYALMASFNSAYDGKKVTADQLKEVLARGYRFIDFNVFVGQKPDAKTGMPGQKKVYVGFSDGNRPSLSDASMLLSEAMAVLHEFAFKKSFSQKSKDKGSMPFTEKTLPPPNSFGHSLGDVYASYPLFLHLRVFRAENSEVDVVKEMMVDLETDPSLYLRETAATTTNKQSKAIEVTGCTPLSVLKKKIIISMDILNLIQIYTPSSDSSAEKIPPTVRQNINQFVNILTGGHTWQAFYKYNDVEHNPKKTYLRLVDDTVRTNVDNFQIAFPLYVDAKNPPIHTWMVEASLQCAPIRVYLEDERCREAEEFFEHFKKPMVPLSYALTYSKTGTK